MNIPMWPISRQIISPLQYRPGAYTILSMPQSLIIVLCVLIPPIKHGQNAERKTRVAERAFRTQRGGYSGFWLPEASHNLFCSLQEGSAVSHNFFNPFFKVGIHDGVNSTTMKFVRRQNLFLSVRKRIREGILTCPTNLVRPETFLLHPKKDLDLGRSAPRTFSGGFIHHFISGEKGFSVQAQEIH